MNRVFSVMNCDPGPVPGASGRRDLAALASIEYPSLVTCAVNRSFRLLSPGLLSILVACAGVPGEPEARGSVAAPVGAPVLAHAAPAVVVEPVPEARVHLDLATHIARAELREGRTLVMDFGVPGGGKYTLGGWRTLTGQSEEFGGSSTIIVPGSTARFVLPPMGPGPHVLKMRARSFGDGRLTLYVDGDRVGNAVLPTDGAFRVVTVPLEELLAEGEHYLRMRVRRSAIVPGIGRVGLAVDWVRIIPADQITVSSDTDAGPAVPDPSELAPPLASAMAAPVGEDPALHLPRGFALGYALEVPTGAELRGELAGEGALTVVAHPEGAEPVTLVDGLRAGSRLRVDLADFVGDVVRLDLQSSGADLSILQPAVVTTEIPTLRPEPPQVENVVIITVDTLRADKLHAYNRESRVVAPALDSLVGSSAVLYAQAQENWTKPSVATLLSGLFPWQHHTAAEGTVLPNSVTLLSETLSERGFHTAGFVANGFVSNRFGFRQGWSTWRNYVRESRRSKAQFVANDVLEWLDARPQGTPFFLYVQTIDPHVPYIPPQGLIRQYDPRPYNGPVNFSRDRLTLEHIKTGQMRPNARDRERLEALYDAEITYHDEHLQRIIDGLAERGLADNTMLVLTSDHGEELFDHGSVGHGHSMWQELLHVPLFIRIPGLTDGGFEVQPVVGLVDVVPTALHALGLDVPDSLPGRSLVPVMRGEMPDAPVPSVSSFQNVSRSIVLGRYKFMQRADSRLRVFDLQEDPDELHDLSAERPLTLRYLRGLLGIELTRTHRPPHGSERHRARDTDIDRVTRQQLRALGYTGN